ncbi:MAG TPA: hypothetical protein VJU14_10380 [Solirubrobacterales bacterium]|nr:hypothetical protein [Solirubrobacterales bacterium]
MDFGRWAQAGGFDGVFWGDRLDFNDGFDLAGCGYFRAGQLRIFAALGELGEDLDPVDDAYHGSVHYCFAYDLGAWLAIDMSQQGGSV